MPRDPASLPPLLHVTGEVPKGSFAVPMALGDLATSEEPAHDEADVSAIQIDQVLFGSTDDGEPDADSFQQGWCGGSWILSTHLEPR